MGGAYASERLSFARLGKISRGKAKVKTGIGQSDLPGLEGGPRKCDFVVRTRCARLGSIPTGIGFQEQISSHSKLLR